MNKSILIKGKINMEEWKYSLKDIPVQIALLIFAFFVSIFLIFILNKIESTMAMIISNDRFKIYQIDVISKESALIFLMSFLLIHLIKFLQCKYREDK